MSEPTPDERFVDAASNPEAAAAVAALLAEANNDTPDRGEKPEIPKPGDAFVKLPVGVTVNGVRVTEVEVQELTGESEERLAKSRQSDDPSRFYNTVLTEGIVDIGGQDPAEILPQMLVGDRETLFLGIRRATFGDEIEVGVAYCDECREEFDAVFDAKDVTVLPFDGEETFEVSLRKGGKAQVRLPNGADFALYVRDVTLTDAERNSVLLSRCITTLPGGDGEPLPVAGFPSLVRALGIQDRNKILREIDKRQPGPRYVNLEVQHEDCGTKVAIAPIGMGALFPGL